jgi:hypothetical protein
LFKDFVYNLGTDIVAYPAYDAFPLIHNRSIVTAFVYRAGKGDGLIRAVDDTILTAFT